jgi:hypothetical protein
MPPPQAPPSQAVANSPFLPLHLFYDSFNLDVCPIPPSKIRAGGVRGALTCDTPTSRALIQALNRILMRVCLRCVSKPSERCHMASHRDQNNLFPRFDGPDSARLISLSSRSRAWAILIRPVLRGTPAGTLHSLIVNPVQAPMTLLTLAWGFREGRAFPGQTWEVSGFAPGVAFWDWKT